jgi:pimeloyl-ACP methyl ester carboxylesterase
MAFRRTTFEESWFDYDGMNLRVVDTGRGDPLLFAHGLGGKIEDNDLIFPFLADRYRVISVDQPGSGLSDKPEHIDYSVDWLADFLLDFATRIGLDTFYLAGGSQGGLLTLLCCEKAPQRVRKAVVYSPSGVWDANPALAQVMKRMPSHTVRGFMRFTSLFWNSPTRPDYWSGRSRALEFVDEAAQSPGFGRHVFGCMGSVFSEDFRPRFARIAAPLLILWGEHDFGMPVSQGRELKKLVPHAQFETIPEAGHNVLSERPRLCASKIKKFLR